MNKELTKNPVTIHEEETKKHYKNNSPHKQCDNQSVISDISIITDTKVFGKSLQSSNKQNDISEKNIGKAGREKSN